MSPPSPFPPSLRHLPWITLGVAVVTLPVVLVGPVLQRYGVVGADDPPLQRIMSSFWLVLAWGVTAPLAVLVAQATAHGWRRTARAAVVVAVTVLAWVGSLPVWLRFGGTEEPVTLDSVVMAGCTYVLLLGGFAVLTAAWWLLTGASGRRGGRPPRSSVRG